MAEYRFDAAESEFLVKATAAGMLSFMGHSPTLAVREFHGDMHFDPEKPEEVKLKLTAAAESLSLVDKVSPADRAEIERRMRQEVLEVSKYPAVDYDAFESVVQPLGAAEYRVYLRGRFSLHGVVNIEDIETRLRVFDDGIRLGGACELSQSKYGIRLVTALGGAIRLEDRLRVGFELVGRPG